MRWMWIDRIISWQPQKTLSAVKCVTLAEEHLHDHFPAEGNLPAQPVMPASLIIEGMAQTAGILVGSVNNFREKVVLAKIARATLTSDVPAGWTIRYDALLERIDPAGAATSGTVSVLDPGASAPAWQSIGTIDLLFAHADNNMAGTLFPEENFVFSENFRRIVEAAGMRYERADDGPL